MEYSHKSIMLDRVLANFGYLCQLEKPFFVDGTLGLAGHSMAIASMLEEKKSDYTILGLDKDERAIKISREKFADSGLGKRLIAAHDDFNNFKNIMLETSRQNVDGILLDLGVSSMQLDDKTRGFSFTDPEAKLDMRMDLSQFDTAYSIINSYSEEDLARILKDGEERHARKIARAIVIARKNGPVSTVGELLTILEACLPRKFGRTHFATDTFRALRLEVNDEISKLQNTIGEMAEFLSSGGRLAIITFHSIEDRIVKDTFRQLAAPCTCPPKLPQCVCGLEPAIKLITKKPIVPEEEEIRSNPRSRSAKLRIIEKL